MQGAELGQRQRTAAIRRASERPAKSLRNWKRPRSEITPLSAPRTHGCWFLYELLFRAYSRLGFGSLNSTDTRRSPVLDGAVWASVLFSLLSKQSCCYVTLRFVTLRFVTLRYGPPRRRLRPSAMPPWRRHIRTELPGASWAARRRLLQLGDRGSVYLSSDPLVLDHPPAHLQQISLASRRAPSWQVRLGLRYVT